MESTFLHEERKVRIVLALQRFTDLVTGIHNLQKLEGYSIQAARITCISILIIPKTPPPPTPKLVEICKGILRFGATL